MKAIFRFLLLTFLAIAPTYGACTAGTFDYCVEVTIPATPAANHVVHFFTDDAGISGNRASFRTAIASAAGKVQTDGDDIQFFDNTGTIFADQGQVYYDNADGDGWWVFRVPTSSTTTFWIRYGKAGATSVDDFTTSGVFQDFDCVWLNADQIDYSGNSCFGTFNGTETKVAGKAGLGWDLDGSTNYIASTGLNTQTDTTQTITLLFQNENQISSTGTGEVIYHWRSGNLNYQQMGATMGSSTYLGQVSLQSASADRLAWLSGTISASTWQLVTTSVAATTSSHSWRNGVEEDTDTPASGLATRTDHFTVGARDTGGLPFAGVVNLMYLVLGGTATTYPQSGSLAEHDYDYDTFFTPGTQFTVGTETEATTGDGLVYPVIQYFLKLGRSVLIEQAATSASAVCSSSNSDDPTLVGDAADCFGAGLDTIQGGVR